MGNCLESNQGALLLEDDITTDQREPTMNLMCFDKTLLSEEHCSFSCHINNRSQMIQSCEIVLKKKKKTEERIFKQPLLSSHNR